MNEVKFQVFHFRVCYTATMMLISNVFSLYFFAFLNTSFYHEYTKLLIFLYHKAHTKIISLFPSLHLSRRRKKNFTLQMSYEKYNSTERCRKPTEQLDVKQSNVRVFGELSERARETKKSVLRVRRKNRGQCMFTAQHSISTTQRLPCFHHQK